MTDLTKLRFITDQMDDFSETLLNRIDRSISLSDQFWAACTPEENREMATLGQEIHKGAAAYGAPDSLDETALEQTLRFYDLQATIALRFLPEKELKQYINDVIKTPDTVERLAAYPALTRLCTPTPH